MVPSVQDDKESRPPCGSLQLGEDEARKIHCCPFGKQSRDLRIEWEGTEMSALWVQLSPLVAVITWRRPLTQHSASESF